MKFLFDSVMPLAITVSPLFTVIDGVLTFPLYTNDVLCSSSFRALSIDRGTAAGTKAFEGTVEPLPDQLLLKDLLFYRRNIVLTA